MSQPTAPAASVPAQPSQALQARTADVIAILKGGGDYDATFTEAFRAQVPKAKFDEVSAGLAAQLGPVTGVESIVPASPTMATIAVGYRDGVASMRISVTAAPPHQVDGLLATAISRHEAMVGAVVDSFRQLPGTSGFALARLGTGAPAPIASLRPDTPLGIGSAFKLVILAELVRATNAGERRWSDIVTLDGSPLPGGIYAEAPKGTQLTLQEVATKMISVSDNSATDIMLRHLGRTKVEAMLARVGVAHPEGMRPFMSTLDMFKLKGIGKGALAARYLSANEAGRRKMLDGEIAAELLSAIDPNLFKDGKPVLADKLEWFASAADMVRVMDWLRRNTEANPTARAILSANSGIRPDVAARWRYVGYKGGSEPGVMNMTLLLQARDGAWYALAGSWTDPAAPVDMNRFAGLINRAAELAAP